MFNSLVLLPHIRKFSKGNQGESMSTKLAPDLQAEFHCCAEWHLRQSDSVAVLCVYHNAYRLSRNSGVYSAAQGTVAKFFSMNRSTVAQATKWLVDHGFFELISSGKENWESNTYRVLGHREWAAKYPGHCCEKISFGWEQTELGKQLYAASGQRVKFKQFEIQNYRSLGLANEIVLDSFTIFRDENPWLFEHKRFRKRVGSEFWKYLKFICRLPADARLRKTG